MSDLTYVNVHGDVIDPKSAPQAPKVARPSMTRVYDASVAKEHHGWEIVGVPRRLADMAAGAALAEGKTFDLNLWLMAQKRKRIIPRRFEIAEAAQQAADIAKRGGEWLRVEAVAILKAPK